MIYPKKNFIIPPVQPKKGRFICFFCISSTPSMVKALFRAEIRSTGLIFVICWKGCHGRGVRILGIPVLTLLFQLVEHLIGSTADGSRYQSGVAVVPKGTQDVQPKR
jgi:hypothetical protein